MTSPDHDHDDDHEDHDHAGHDHDHAGHDHGARAPALDPAKYEGLDGWEIRTVSDCEQELVASLPRVRFEQLVDTSAKQIARRVTLRGFRPGKAPASRIKQIYGEDIHRDAVEKLVQETWEQAMADGKLRPVASPKLTELEATEGKPVRFTARFEVLPEIEVAGLDGLKLTPKVVTASDADVESEIQNIRMMRARLVESERTEMAPGDFAVLTLMRWEPGAPREGEPAETREDLVIECGNERNLPDLDRTLVGMRPGEARDFETEVPAGPDAKPEPTAFRVFLKEIKTRELPDLDTALIGSLGIGTFDDVESFRAEVKRRMVEQRAEMAKREQEAEAMDHLLRQNAFGVPPSLIDSEAEARLRRGVEGLVRRGVDVENAAIDWATELVKLREHAEKDLRADWLLELAGRAKGIQVSDEDVEKEIEGIAREREMPPAAVRAELEKNKQISNLRASLRRRRTLDLLRSGATISVE